MTDEPDLIYRLERRSQFGGWEEINRYDDESAGRGGLRERGRKLGADRGATTLRLVSYRLVRGSTSIVDPATALLIDCLPVGARERCGVEQWAED